jgi:hypothetical protein
MDVRTTKFVSLWRISSDLHPTVTDVLKYMEENDIPMTAEVKADEMDGPILEWDVIS